ncbi:choice-of-anchor B family protein [Candidatus Palauibacter sp.]|uniref:choice-of-anchor B family protein n=1 Tax=Candidatus Palauibacter sp. TaxID=3101350 RepID=UPI003B52DEFF
MRFPQSRFVRLVGMGALFAGTMPSPAAAQTHARSLDDAAAAPLIGFGAAVAVSGGEIFVSRPGEFVGFPMPGSEAGSVHVFRRDEDGWAEVATIEAPSGVYGDGFGTVLAVRNDFLVVGAPKENDRRGAAYVFVREGGAWHLLERLEAPDAVPGDDFGSSITMETGYGRSISWLLGAPGRGTTGSVFRYLYYSADQVVRRGGFDTTGRDELTGSSAPDGARFGAAVSLDGDMVLVGAPGSEFFEGIGFVFERDEDGGWTEATPFHETGSGLQAVTGEERRCSDQGTVAGFSCADVDLVSLLPPHEVGGSRGIMVNDIWGWVDPQTGREYAILGRFDGTSFIDVTDAGNPVYLGDLPLTEGATPNLWRDMKVYADHTFIVADNAGEHGIQVFDLTRLRDVTNPPVEFDEDAHYSEFHSAHNIVINEESGFAYVVGGSGGGQTCGGALHMVDIRDPLNPTFAGCYADPDTGNAGSGGYTHDAQCVTYRGPDADYAGREVCFNASAAKLGIGDVTDKDNPRPIANASHPNVAFSHQGWLSEDQRYFYLNDELDEIQGLATGTRTLVWDVQDLDEPVLVREFVQDNPATDHNLYVRGDFMYQSNYVSGLRIFDISDPENPAPAGFFDTVPGSPDQPGFAGSFSNYPFFPSGNIIVSSMREGMFVLRKRETALVP